MATKEQVNTSDYIKFTDNEQQAAALLIADQNRTEVLSALSTIASKLDAINSTLATIKTDTGSIDGKLTS